ncbi:uncharacterized protein PHACADRAFT_167655 [Phanerochaete carnosa HHB-10118-sp]|uniref:Uncharacterized protein n=1 Tax=Phanerochaete carnosa (strain HHB-10118-sp) TaxID=650164 RepID=K5WLD2_PHACS|nr:uncharacterized protein PHACADRAFT_167655 [Phanerochaete carnosa HHB-10118-sp]EKM60240.1 hypothetical protein PHACADRAFT_167655 [Phanerochaete carnosa HHB-10118-sp]
MLFTPFPRGYSVVVFIYAFIFFISASSALTNVTVDDQGADPTTTYGISYTSGWSIGQTCTGCSAQPDPAQAHGGTWHDTTYDPSIEGRNTPQNATFDFTGSAVYVYGILSHSTTAPVSGADITFFIDGVKRGSFSFTPNGPQNTYTYNQLLFTIDGLEEASHAFVLQNGQIDGPISLVLLDYLIYTK